MFLHYTLIENDLVDQKGLYCKALLSIVLYTNNSELKKPETTVLQLIPAVLLKCKFQSCSGKMSKVKKKVNKKNEYILTRAFCNS